MELEIYRFALAIILVFLVAAVCNFLWWNFIEKKERRCLEAFKSILEAYGPWLREISAAADLLDEDDKQVKGNKRGLKEKSVAYFSFADLQDNKGFDFFAVEALISIMGSVEYYRDRLDLRLHRTYGRNQEGLKRALEAIKALELELGLAAKFDAYEIAAKDYNRRVDKTSKKNYLSFFEEAPTFNARFGYNFCRENLGRKKR